LEIRNNNKGTFAIFIFNVEALYEWYALALVNHQNKWTTCEGGPGEWAVSITEHCREIPMPHPGIEPGPVA